jgi:CO dehydrogenase maturation factor
MCRSHAAVRSLVADMVEKYERPTVIDMEAGLEHLSRGTGQKVDTLLIVLEPYYKSMETAARIKEIAGEMEDLGQIYAVANKTRSEEDESALRQFCEQRDLNLIAMVPEDETVRQADRRGVALLDHDASAPAVRSITALAERLMAHA